MGCRSVGADDLGELVHGCAHRLAEARALANVGCLNPVQDQAVRHPPKRTGQAHRGSKAKPMRAELRTRSQ